ncbi:hypothetical protein PRO82_002273 [Candidatus Protochlamydia amoebophila]|nr:hypothetical protein [Candidatus Protochlamydia amoebophila]
MRLSQIIDKALTFKFVALIIKRNKRVEDQNSSFFRYILRAEFVTTAAIFECSLNLVQKDLKNDFERKY